MRLFDMLHNMMHIDNYWEGISNMAALYTKESHSNSYLYNFCADNAYSYIKKQVSFGPRIPGSQASRLCSKWIVGKLQEFGVANIKEQHSQQVAYNGKKFEAINISAQINPNAQNHIILVSHWDSRPWADQDKNPANRMKAIDGANDGASGVGVILELARVFSHTPIKYGIDILFVDAEDCGQRVDSNIDVYDEFSWSLGTQYWMANPTLDLSRVIFTILLDMVGGKGTVFFREYISQCVASNIYDLIWNSAFKAKKANRFQDELGRGIIDDHVYFLLNRIPAIAIIGSDPDTGSFSPTWHTLNDTIENIDTEILKAVGETLEQFLR